MPGATPLEREQQPRRGPRLRRRVPQLLGGLAAGLVGFGLNQLELHLVPAVQLVFGPLAVLAAALLLGPVGGGVAGALAGLATFLRWGHPWAWLGMALEGLCVGLLSRRVRPLRSVGLYWLVGLPYVLAAYVWGLEVPFPDAAIVATKQCLNSLLAMLLVYVLLLVPAVRRRVGPWLPAPLRSVRLADTVAAALLLGTALPLVTVGAVEGRGRYAAERARLDEQNQDAARRVADTLARSLAAGLRSATILAALLSDEAARTGALPPPERLQQLLAHWLDNSPGLTASYVGDARGRALAYYPAEAARELAGYADRDYFRALQRERRPLLSGVFDGRVVPGPKVAAVAPVWRGTQLAGYVALAVDVAALGELASARLAPEQRARLLDPRGLVVVDSAAAPARAGALTPVSALPLGAALAAGAERGEYVSDDTPVTLRRVRASHAYAVV
ncbi:MAG TPA: cache domain-containing protein, partial [Aggregicoccus sp.]|nr:cache domain-containing protein [Aggregicoccus sp.]